MYIEFNLSNTGTAPVPLLKQSCQNNGNSTCWDQAKDFFLFLGMNLTSQLLRCKMTPSILGLGEGVINCLLHFISILNPVGGVIQFSQHIKFDTARWNMQTDRSLN